MDSAFRWRNIEKQSPEASAAIPRPVAAVDDLAFVDRFGKGAEACADQEAACRARSPGSAEAVSDPGAAFRLLEPDDAAKLVALHLVAGIRSRRARFSAAVNDESVRRRCEGLDWSRFFAIGAFVNRRMDAVVEIFRIDDDWRRAEAAATGMPYFDRASAAALAASAALEARARGCRELVLVEPAPSDPWRRALTQVGEAEGRGADVVIRL